MADRTIVRYSAATPASFVEVPSGLDGGGVVDNHERIQAAIDETLTGVIYLPKPTTAYRVADEIIIRDHRVRIIGPGKNVHSIFFDPSADNKACFVFDTEDDTAVVQNAIMGLGISGSGNTKIKYGIKSVGSEELVIEDVAIHDFTDATFSCEGYRSEGKHMTRLYNPSFTCDIPVHLCVNPYEGIDSDGFHIFDSYFIAAGTNAHVLIDSNVHLGNLLIDGINNWCKGSYGVKWIDTETAEIAYAVSVNNIRWEQVNGTSGYLIDIEHNYSLWNLILNNLKWEGPNGVKIRKCLNVTMSNLFYGTAGEFLNADATCRPIVLMNCFAQAGSTLSVSGLTKSELVALPDTGSTVGPLTIYSVPK